MAEAGVGREAPAADPKLAEYRDAEPFTTKHKKANAEKARRDLGMKTTVHLPEGVANTVAWMKKHYNFGH